MTPSDNINILEPSFKERAESLKNEFLYNNLKNYLKILNDSSNYTHYNKDEQIKATFKTKLKNMIEKRKPKKIIKK
jgi:hypothetical protein